MQPTTVTVELMDPTGAVSTPDPTFDSDLETSDGITAAGYYVEVDAEVWGQWYWRWEATGIGQAAKEGGFYVEKSAFPPSGGG